MPFRLFITIILALLAMGFGPAPSFAADGWKHAMAIVGEPKYPQGFAHFDYVNPDAPKGGTLELSALGSFDTLNPVPAKGDLATGLGLVFETLMISSEDEIATTYGLLAEAVRFPDDYSSVTFRLRANARWHDGIPVTPDDVIFSFEKAVASNPRQQFYYAHVVKVEKTGEREVTFTFDEKGNRELPKIVGDLLIVPKHYWQGKDSSGQPRDVAATTLEPVPGSGPYRIAAVRPGESVTFERVEDYWGKDINVNVGRNNFETVRYTYYGDRNVEFQSFKAGNIDFWMENEARRWANAYNFPAVIDGRIKRETFENPYRSRGIMVGFIPNLRLEKFQNADVRRALNYAFDFEELNRTIFFGQYSRIDSYFYGTELASSGLPEGRELEILEEVRDLVPASVFDTPYTNPVGGSKARERDNLREAVRLFAKAGYELRGKRMVNTKTGEAFGFEILLNGSIIEKVALPFKKNLEKIGVRVTVRSVDSSQYVNRLRARDFDVTYQGWAQSLSPGNEQLEYWGSEAARRDGSANYAGISDPGIDALIRKVVFAADREELIAATRALDRVLLAHDYVVPSYTRRSMPIAYWTTLERPEKLPTYSIGFPSIWWAKQDG